jgi:hypothetical protein
VELPVNNLIVKCKLLDQKQNHFQDFKQLYLIAKLHNLQSYKYHHQ